MLWESQDSSSERAGSKEFHIFENFLHRFGVDVSQVADRSFIETQLGDKKNVERGYSVHASVEFEDMRFPPYWHHGFSEKDPITLQFRPVMYIANHIKDRLIVTCGESELKNFTTHMTALLNFANHDFTAHAVGIDSGSKPIAAIAAVVQFDESRYGKDLPERLAAISHRKLFEKACQQSPRLKLYVVREAREAIRTLQKLDDNSRSELISAIRYLLYCLIDPRDPVLEPLRARFSNGSSDVLPKTEWARIVHQHSFRIKGSDKHVSDEDLTNILYSHPARLPIAHGKKRVSVADEARYQKEIEALVITTAK